MGRPPKGTAPGRSSDFTGEKKAFLESFYDRLLEAGFGSGGDPGPIYTEVTDKWLQRYGYDLPLNQNVEGDPVDNPPADQSRSTDEKNAIRKALRTKISGWYCTRYQGKKVHTATIKEILTTMQSMSGQTARPRRKAAMVLYSKLHYTTRVKPEFDKVWASVKDTVPCTMRAAMSQDFVGTCWQKESEAFRQEIEERAKEDHRIALEAWKAKRVVPERSAETYHEALENLNDVSIPLVDALAEHLGMHIVLMAVGPVGDADGEVLLRSVFSDTAAGATSRTWPQFDHPGFTAMEKSITRYGRAFFTKAECQERVWPPPATENTAVPNLDGLLPINSSASTTITDNPIPETPRNPTPETAAAVTTPLIDVVGTPAAPSEETTPLDGIDRSEWSDTLTRAHPYLASKKWDATWTGLVEALVRFEWSWYHNDMCGRLGSGGRPPEFAQWMKEHRVWDDYNISEDFGEQLLEWWRCIGPSKRWEDVPKGEAPHPRHRLAGLGTNSCFGSKRPYPKIWNAGVATGLGGGDAALAAADDWHLLAEDLKWALEGPLLRDRIGEEKTAEEEQERAEGEKEGAEKKTGKGKKGTTKEPAKKRKRVSDQEGASESSRKRPKVKSASAEVPARPRLKPKPLTRSSKFQDTASAPSPAPPANSTAADDVPNTHSDAQNAGVAEGIPAGDAPPVLEAASGVIHTVSTVIGGTPPPPSPPRDKMPDQDTAGMDVDKELDLDVLAGLTEEERAEMLADPDADDGEA
ncbi:hypothetical protein K438DRAFT_1955171 [Mycena galopus ATCC 62051]|nr:hypothetical protein K438DRAFT_1955171 [Mycena galopus ATCC 62051]